MGFLKVELNKVDKNEQSQRNPDIYSPKWTKDLQDGKYVAYIRLLPNMINPEKTIIAKETSYLREPTDRMGRARAYDSPNTVGQKDNPINQLYWDLKNTKDPEKEKLANDCLATTRNYYAFIQVVSDHNINGEKDLKVMIWRFGKKIYDKIINESEDSDVVSLTSTSVLKLVLTQQGGNNNYDLSKFVNAEKMDIPSTYCFAKDGQYFTVSEDMSDEDCEYVEDQLKELELALNREDMEYHPWTPEQEEEIRKHCERVRMYAYPELMAGRQSFTGVAPVAPVSAPAAQVLPNAAQDAQAAIRPIAPVASAPAVAAKPVVAAAPVAPVITKPAAAKVAAKKEDVQSGYSDDDLDELLGAE